MKSILLLFIGWSLWLLYYYYYYYHHIYVYSWYTFCEMTLCGFYVQTKQQPNEQQKAHRHCAIVAPLTSEHNCLPSHRFQFVNSRFVFALYLFSSTHLYTLRRYKSLVLFSSLHLISIEWRFHHHLVFRTLHSAEYMRRINTYTYMYGIVANNYNLTLDLLERKTDRCIRPHYANFVGKYEKDVCTENVDSQPHEWQSNEIRLKKAVSLIVELNMH